MRMDKMAKKMLIDATHAEETRVVVVDGNKVEEFDFESQARRQLAGNIYLAKVTRVEPSLQAAFIDYGGNRHGFLAFSEIHPDYYQIPVADREALMAEEKAYAESMKAEEEEDEKPKRVNRSRRGRGRAKPVAADASSADVVVTEAVEQPEEASEDVISGDIAGMEVLDLGEADEGESPMVNVADTPVDTPSADDEDDSDGNDDGEDDAIVKTVEADETIESVAEEDDSEEVRPVRKPRPRRYKIQEVVNVRQILLVQVVKEERGNKGAALTTYLSLAGRYCVLMPNTARGGGISRKITNIADRKKLKEIASEIDVPDGAGLIIRTAGSQRTKPEIKRDYEYLQRLWEQVREFTLNSIAPAKIYEEGDLIKRTIRDLYSKEIDEVIVSGDLGYRTAKDFMKMIMPSHAKNVKNYNEKLPLFARFQVEGYLSGMFNPTVQLPSGGYIVIDTTEALVAVDVNSGRATKEGSIEQTALKTNLEAAEEVARQLRLRDLAGLIVIDFIDMDERRNNIAVEKRMKDKLKTDRARIQVGRISGFGLLEMSRQRLRPGMLEATTQPCPHCHGTGLLRSDDNVALAVLRQLEEEGVRGRSREVLLKAPIAIANFMMNGKREHIADIEARYGMAVRIECDPTLISPDFTIEKFKTATRIVPEAAPVVASAAMYEEVEEEIVEPVEVEAEAETPVSAEDQPRKKRRRRRRRRGGGGGGENANAEAGATEAEDGESVKSEQETGVQAEAVVDATDNDEPVEKPKRTRRSRTRKPAADAALATDEAAPSGEAAPEVATDVAAEEAPKPKRAPRTRRKKVVEDPAEASAETGAAEVTPEVAEAPKPKRVRRTKKVIAEEAAAAALAAGEAVEPAVEETPKPKRAPRARKKAVVAEPVSEPVVVEIVSDPVPAQEAPVAVERSPAPEPVADPAPVADDKPKRKGWWSMGR